MVKDLGVFMLRRGTIQECPLSLLFFNVVVEVLDNTERQKGNKRYTTGKKEMQLSLISDDMTIYVNKKTNKT